MAQYTVDHTCGHSQTHNLIGPHKERDRKLEWLAGTVCSECYHAKKEADRHTANTAAAEANTAAGLSALIGSEKQVAWAESIRKPICAALVAAEAAVIQSLNPELSETAREEIGDAIVLVVEEVRGRTEANWWIEEGQELRIRDAREAQYYLATQIHERGLAPTAAAESQEIDQRHREQQIQIIREIETGFSSDALVWTGGCCASGTIAGHAVSQEGIGIYAKLMIDGVRIPDHTGCVIRDKVSDWIRGQAEVEARAERQARHDSLAGAQVAQVNKIKQDIKVTLTDGRILHGASDRDGWHLTSLDGGKHAQSIDRQHPEVARLAAQAKAWFKAHPETK